MVRRLCVSERVKSMKICVCHVSAHQKVTLAEKDFSNQVDRTTCSVDTSRTLSPAIAVIAELAHGQSDQVAGMKVIQEFKNTDFHPPRLTWP